MRFLNAEWLFMSRGDQPGHTEKQKRLARHIEVIWIERGFSLQASEKRVRAAVK